MLSESVRIGVAPRCIGSVSGRNSPELLTPKPTWYLLRGPNGTGSKKNRTTVNNGYLGSRNDEERSEMRYVMRIAEFSESSNLWTQIALSGYPWEHTSLSVGLTKCHQFIGDDSLSVRSLGFYRFKTQPHDWCVRGKLLSLNRESINH